MSIVPGFVSLVGRLGRSFIRCRAASIAVMLIAHVTAAELRGESSPKVLAEWAFNEEVRWNGWQPGASIQNVEFTAEGVSFDATGADPIIGGPLFEVAPATNSQWVEIDITTARPALSGELFYTSKTTGGYDGFESNWVSGFWLGGSGPQQATVWPFWSDLGKIIRLRVDPPAGRCTLRAIRVCEVPGVGPDPQWRFGGQADSWRPMHAARMTRDGDGMTVEAAHSQTVILSPVKPFDAERRSLLQLDGECEGEQAVMLFWATEQEPGFFGEALPLPVPESGFDLRQFPEWKGTVTHLALAFGSRGDETLKLRSLGIGEIDPSVPYIRAKYVGFERGITRPAFRPVRLRIILEHVGGPALPAGTARVQFTNETSGPVREVDVPSIRPGEKTELSVPVVARHPGMATVTLTLATGQVIEGRARIDEPIADEQLLDAPPGEDVPPPAPIATDYEIGVYYFPGWSPDQMYRWELQADFPERDSLLGWYEEGRPEVADWHIKWAVENGISFFIYDWYWKEGEEMLAAGLNEGFLKARYRERMKFAVMWANHPPFADHTLEQLLEVTDYWIEHYFRLPNYWTVDGQPYVSFFSFGDLLEDMKTEENIRDALEAMRERVRAAGLPGIFFAACTGGDVEIVASIERAGFDAVTAYNYARIGSPMKQGLYKGYQLAHEEVWNRIESAGHLRYIPLLTVGWDSRPWHGPRAMAYTDRRSAHFALGLERLKSHLDKTGGKIAILEAWNEFGEGSYIEPNNQFGFADLESIRKTFASPGNWPQNVGPDDVGLADKYDLRRKLHLAGKHPAIRRGMELICRGDCIAITPGTYMLDGTERHTRGGQIGIAPAETVTVENLPIKLNDTPVKKFRGGNRLLISPDDRRNATPDSYVRDSLRLSDPARPDVEFSCPADYTVDDVWGAFAITPSGKLQAGQEVLASYALSLRRVDALIVEAGDKLRVVRGTPSIDCPEMPTVRPGVLHIANVYRPFNAKAVKPAHVYLPGKPATPPAPANTESLASVLGKLRRGEPVTIVCWGDSVTVGGDASSPATSYVGVFETMLKERFPTAPIEVINAGIGGSSTGSRLPNFQKEVLDFEPDVVTLEFVNDMGYPVEQMQQRYAEILTRVREAGAALVLMTPHFTRPDWMGLPAGRGDDSRGNVAFLREFAAEHKVPLADASRRWAELEHLGVPYEILLKNGINHPDDRGHRFFAEELMRLFPASQPASQ